jgi:hypothetical protein
MFKMSKRNPGPADKFKAKCYLLFKTIPQETTDEVATNFAIPQFDPKVGVAAQLEDLERKLETFLSSRQEFLQEANKDRKERVKFIIAHWYRNSYPVVETVLSIAKEASAVSSLQ